METEPIFERNSPHAAMLLDRVSPLIRDLHGKLLKGTELPFEIGPEVVYKRRERLATEQDAISSRMTQDL